jgi:hypothetical protein
MAAERDAMSIEGHLAAVATVQVVVALALC